MLENYENIIIYGLGLSGLEVLNKLKNKKNIIFKSFKIWIFAFFAFFWVRFVSEVPDGGYKEVTKY